MGKITKMFTKESLLAAVNFVSLLPDKLVGLTVLDKELFSVTTSVPAIRCKAVSCGKIRKEMKAIMLNRAKFSSIVASSEPTEKLVLLNPLIKSVECFNDDQREVFEKENGVFCVHDLLLTYKDFTSAEIFQKVIPNEFETVSAFETVGHIAHVNLKSHLLQYKTLIGQVIVDKNPVIETVVNKTDSIDNTFRFFKMEVIAGVDKMQTQVIEHGCRFQFDYSKVYWNSRLHTEHQRIVKLTSPTDVVFDVTAGVGPFSIPAAKNKCVVYANDLNIESFEALKNNIKINKLSKAFIYTYNLDAREFFTQVVIPKVQEINVKSHIILNLPAIGYQFLDVFAKDNHLESLKKSVMVHCSIFSTSDEPEVDVRERISKTIGFEIQCKTHFVRRVAPKKVMLSVSFDIRHHDNETPCKKAKYQ